MNIPKLFKQHFINKGDEQTEMFRLIRNEFEIKKGLNPGSFVHFSPSLVISEMVYVDSDKRCKPFFNENNARVYLENNKDNEGARVYQNSICIYI